MSPDEFRRQGHRMVDWVADYMERVESLPVLAEVAPGDVLDQLPDSAPEQAGGADEWDAIFDDLDRMIVPATTHWQSPSFFGYFPCNASGPAILGELASAGLGVQGMLWQTSPACTELEMRMLDWMAQAIGLPESFTFASELGGGSIQGTASEATLVAMVAGRKRVQDPSPASLEDSFGTISPRGRGRVGVYASEQAHSSVIKSAMIAGLARDPDDRSSVRLIKTDADLRMDCAALGRAIRDDVAGGISPAFVCATVGTTGTTAVDPIADIVRVVRETGGERVWIHVDAAHAGSALVCPEFRWMIEGVGGVDSFCFNPHKWLLTNFDCDLMWTRDRSSLIRALSITPEYLMNAPSESGGVVDYRDWQIPLGRRFRALKLWFVLRHYGLEGLREHIRGHVRLARLFEDWVLGDDRFELCAERTVNLVCFRMLGSDEQNRVLLDRLNASGRLYLTHTTVPGHGLVLRMSIGAGATREEHVRAAWDRIVEEADGLRA